MTDLDRQLRDCLSRHAEDALPAPNLAAGARRRSRQLGRRMPLIVAAIAPLALAGVVGAASLVGSSTSSERLKDRPSASLTVSATPGATRDALLGGDRRHRTYVVCATGKVPNLHELTTSDVKPASRLVTERQFVAIESRRYGGHIRALAVSRSFAIDGRHRHPLHLAFQLALPHGRHLWRIGYIHPHRHDQLRVHDATFKGCVRA